jgi:predicted secreted protein
VLNKEFETDEIVFKDDKIHDSLGQEGPVGGCYPDEAGEFFNDAQVLETTVTVQLFGEWTAKVDPEQTVSPGLVEERAERIRRACKEDEVGAPGTEHLWYYRVIHVTYPDDPTGNKTRLLATVLAFSQNAGLVETNG